MLLLATLRHLVFFVLRPLLGEVIQPFCPRFVSKKTWNCSKLKNWKDSKAQPTSWSPSYAAGPAAAQFPHTHIWDPKAESLDARKVPPPRAIWRIFLLARRPKVPITECSSAQSASSTFGHSIQHNGFTSFFQADNGLTIHTTSTRENCFLTSHESDFLKARVVSRVILKTHQVSEQPNTNLPQHPTIWQVFWPEGLVNWKEI